MRKFYLECGVVWRLYGHEIECKGNIQGGQSFDIQRGQLFYGFCERRL